MQISKKIFFNIYLNKGGKNIDNKYETKKKPTTKNMRLHNDYY